MNLEYANFNSLAVRSQTFCLMLVPYIDYTFLFSTRVQYILGHLMRLLVNRGVATYVLLSAV